MRMNRSQDICAKKVVNTYSERELGDIFREYGEEKNWRRAARAVVKARLKKRIETTKELADIIASQCRRSRKRLHPATLVFQALRIFVNKELEAIQEGVSKAINMLTSGGLIGTLSFHRLEDRIVKNIFREASRPIKRMISLKEQTFLPLLKLVTKSPMTPSRQERRENPRSRSAKLRFAEKI